MAATPEFVRWTLPFACALRDDTDVTSAEQTERQLRSLRTYSDCVHKGRESERICVSDIDPGMGFPSQEVLQAYGGTEFVHQQCDTCHVNVLRGRQGSGLAGCFGTLLMGAERGRLIEMAIERSGMGARVAELFLPTTPRWHGLWTQAELSGDQRQTLLAIFGAIDHAAMPDLREFHVALSLALQHHLPVHVQSYPAGEAERDFWRVNAHCSRCKATMGQREQRCTVCGLLARAEPVRQRKARGNRPYVPLVRFLGEAGARDFAARYAAEHGEP